MKRYDIPVIWQEAGMISVLAEDETTAINVALHKTMTATESPACHNFITGSLHIAGTPVLRDTAATLNVTLSVPTDTFGLITAAEVWSEGDDLADAIPPDERYVFTAMFENQHTIDICCEGSDNGRPIITAIMFDPYGREVYRQRENAFAGLHIVQYDGIPYTVFITSAYD